VLSLIFNEADTNRAKPAKAETQTLQGKFSVLPAIDIFGFSCTFTELLLALLLSYYFHFY
jgi:hypothetical protein